MSRPLRVAVVGVGHLGSIHARIYAAHPGAELAYVVDTHRDRAEAIASEHGARALSDVRELPEDVDAASIVVPTVFHAEAAIPLLERGVPCLVEKPLAVDLATADRILEAAQRGGARLAVGHVERFQPGVRKLDELGLEPRFLECHRLTRFPFREMDVGVVHDLMIHDLDLVLHFVDSELESVDAAGGRILTESEDMASVRLVFANGARANVTASRVSLTPMRRLRMFASSGYVSLDFAEGSGIFVRKGEGWEAGLRELKTGDPAQLAKQPDFVTNQMLDLVQLELQGEERPLQAELDAFLRVAREGTEPLVTGEQGRRALAVAERIRTSTQQQGW